MGAKGSAWLPLIGSFAGAIAVILVAIAGEQIGIDATIAGYVTLSIFAGLIIAIVGGSATMALDRWRTGHSAMTPLPAAASMAIVGMGGWTLASEAGPYFTGSPAAGTGLLAICCGIAISMVFPLRLETRPASGLDTAAAQGDSRDHADMILPMLLAAISLVACVLFAAAQLQVAASMARAQTGFGPLTALVLAGLAAGLPLLATGFVSVQAIAAMTLGVLGAAFIGPLVWLSATATGNPFPHLAHPDAAGQSLATIESELSELGLAEFGERIQPVIGEPSGFAAAAVFVLLCGLGYSALPLFNQFANATGTRDRANKAGVGAILICVAVLGVAPAIAQMAKLAMYDDLLGVSLAEAGVQANWLFAAGGSLANPGLPAISVCGAEAAYAASANVCGTQRLLSPSDFVLSPEVMTLHFGGILGLPSIVSAMTTTTIAAAAIAAAAAAAFAAMVQVSAAGDLRAPQGYPAGPNLFFGRAIIILVLLAALIVATLPAISPAMLIQHALAIGAGVLAPVLAIRRYFPGFSVPAAITAGLASAATLGLHALFWHGFEPAGLPSVELRIAGIGSLSQPLQGAVLAIVAGPIAALTHKLMAAAIAALRARNRIRQVVSRPSKAGKEIAGSP